MNFDQTFHTKPANETAAEQMLITSAQSATVTSPSAQKSFVLRMMSGCPSWRSGSISPAANLELAAVVYAHRADGRFAIDCHPETDGLSIKVRIPKVYGRLSIAFISLCPLLDQ